MLRHVARTLRSAVRAGLKACTTRSICAFFICAAASATISVSGQSGATKGEWRTYAADLGSTRYSPLDQINAANFNTLEIAWRFKTDALGPRPEFKLESTPLMVNGVLY